MQSKLAFPDTHGGRRVGAGRKPKREAERVGVPHRQRSDVRSYYPMLVTIRCAPLLPSLRAQVEIASLVMKAIEDSAVRGGFRILEYTVQSNHLHLIIEADDASKLSRGVTGLKSRVSRRMNRLLKRQGPVFAGRYHHRVLRSPRQVHNALDYTLHNHHKHGELLRGADPFSSALQFTGWDEVPARATHRVLPQPRTWLLRHGWIDRHGPLALQASPLRRAWA